MATQVQLRRGTTTQHSTFTGALGEVTFDTDKNTLIVHDGSTAGGHELAKSGVAGSFTTGSFSSDVTVSGNLTVNGTTTTVNTATINLADNIITLNSDETGTPSQNAGIEVERGTSNNVYLTWNESSDKWRVTEDGSNYYDILHSNDIGVTVQGYDADTAKLDVAQSWSADQTFGDNVKAIFGAGSDLQIYHDGSNSFIKDTGTGDLILQGSNAVRIRSDIGENMAIFNANGSSTLQYDNSTKLATTATGIDVTGSIDAVGLNIDGATDASVTYLRFKEYSSSYAFNGTYFKYDGSSNVLSIGRHNVSDSSTANDIDVMSIGRSNGDVSFYEATGQNAKMFWDASAASLGIGTETPQAQLEIASTTGLAGAVISTNQGSDSEIEFRNTYSGDHTWAIGQDYSNSRSFSIAYANAVGASLSTGNVFTIDTGGNVGIGTDSPATALEVKGIGFINDSGSTTGRFVIRNSTTGPSSGGLDIRQNNLDTDINNASNGVMTFKTNNTERMRIDSSGNLMASKSSVNAGLVGHQFAISGSAAHTRDGGSPLYLNRLTSDGEIATFNKDTVKVGSIGVEGGDLVIGTGTNCGLQFKDNLTAIRPFNIAANAPVNNAVSLGISSHKFKDGHFAGTLYAARGIANTRTQNSASGSQTENFADNQNFIYNMVGNITLSNPSNPVSGQTGFIIFNQDSTGGRTVSLGSYFKTPGGAGLTLSTSANATDMVPYVIVSSTEILLGTPQLAFA